jgi:hypothetical protein
LRPPLLSPKGLIKNFSQPACHRWSAHGAARIP